MGRGPVKWSTPGRHWMLSYFSLGITEVDCTPWHLHCYTLSVHPSLYLIHFCFSPVHFCAFFLRFLFGKFNWIPPKTGYVKRLENSKKELGIFLFCLNYLREVLFFYMIWRRGCSSITVLRWCSWFFQLSRVWWLSTKAAPFLLHFFLPPYTTCWSISSSKCLGLNPLGEFCFLLGTLTIMSNFKCLSLVNFHV